MRFAIKNLCFLVIFALVWPFSAAALVVQDISIESDGKAEVLTVVLDGSATHKVFALENPDRLVIDLPTFTWNVDSDRVARAGSKYVGRIRYARFNDTTSRIVMDMQVPVSFEEIRASNARELEFRLTPQGDYTAAPAVQKEQPFNPPFWSRRNNKSMPPRVIVQNDNRQPETKPAPVSSKRPTALPTSVQRPRNDRDKPLVIIDAGHGGPDPGAKGRQNTREKDVTLRYARALRDALQGSGQYRVELTRDSDKIILLRERFRIARKKKADLFISLHADSAPNTDARGLSIYTLSETASDKEAEMLANQENLSDALVDVDLSHEDEEVAGILIDLARRETKNKSVTLAENIVKAMKGKIRLLANPHRHAGFAVLKAPDIPSVLVEVGFLTNRDEEKLINTRDHQAKVVDGLVQGITKYFASRR